MRIIIKPDLVIILIRLYNQLHFNHPEGSAVRLSELKKKQTACVAKIHRDQGNDHQVDMVASRLETLGFVSGARVQVIAKGIFGGDPILIQIGFTRFALRKVEAEKVEIYHEKSGVSA